MTDILTRLKIQILGEDDASDTLRQVDKSVENTGMGMKAISKVVKDLSVGIGIFGGAITKAFDFGEQGAAVTQTAESFDLLLDKVNAAPDLLNQLRDASRGTVDDLSLMSSTATLLAGTQGDLAEALADATPQLLEIAKAANKLNPSLGDTTFLYKSLATGIKRNSSLMIDNTGVVVKLGEANQKYADSIGKTVDQLTAEEEKMALLFATLEGGQTMIEQVGGDVDSLTDSFERLDASTKNLVDSVKANFAPGLADAADALNLMITGSSTAHDAFIQQRSDLARSSESWWEYSKGVLDAARHTAVANLAANNLNIPKTFLDSLALMRDTLLGLDRETVKALASSRELAGLMADEYSVSFGTAEGAVRSLSDGLKDGVWKSSNLAVKGLDNATESMEEAKEAAEDLGGELDDLDKTLKRLSKLGGSWDDYFRLKGWTYDPQTGWDVGDDLDYMYNTPSGPTTSNNAPTIIINDNRGMTIQDQSNAVDLLSPIIDQIINR